MLNSHHRETVRAASGIPQGHCTSYGIFPSIRAALLQLPRCSLLRAALSVVAILLANLPLSAADPDLPEIARRLQEWRGSFANMEVVYHGWNREHLEPRFPEIKNVADLDGKYYRRHELIWTDTGSIWRENFVYENEILVSRSLQGTNGQVAFRAFMDRGSPMDKWMGLGVYPVVGVPKAGSVFEPLCRLWWDCGQDWLGDILTRDKDARLRGYEVRDGVRCAVVEVPKRSARDPDVFDMYELFLDCEHDFLLRSFTRDLLEEHPDLKLSPPRSMHTFTVTEFQKLPNGRWFPWRGFLKAPGDDEPGNEWVVKEVKLNQSYSPRRFEPPPRPTVAQRRASVERRIAEQANQNLADAGPPLTAELPETNWTQIFVLVASAITLVAGIWLSMRRA